MQRFLLVLFIINTSIICKAQSIKGIVSSANGEPLVNAAVLLLKQKDSAVIKSALTDIEGKFTFDTAVSFPVLLSIAATGHQSVYIQVNNKELQQINLSLLNKSLQEVVVTARKPMIEVRPDKTIFNVESSINAIGNSAFDLLRKSPGVVIDNNDNISLLGNGVAIYIDNKPSPLTGTELASFLRALQSTDIELIELIKNPSAKYDAAGTGGIINIRLKKNKNYGLNGSINTSYAIGNFPKYNNGLNLNYRNKRVNLFGNYSYYTNRNRSFINLYREQADSVFDQRSVNNNTGSGHNLKAGADFFINKKNTIGLLVTVFADEWTDRNLAKTPMLALTTKEPGRTLIADNRVDGNKQNYNFNINYKYTDTSGRDWNTDIDFGIFSSLQDALQPNQYKTANLLTVLEEKIYTIATDRDITVFTVKSDYEQNVKGGRLGFGLKSSIVKTSNDFLFSSLIDNAFITDDSRSNRFNLTENINAAYINYRKKIKKWELQAGLRTEHTYTRGLLSSTNIQTDRDVIRNYLNLFPSFGAAYQLNNKNSFNLNYSRRINRPGYQSLNPFENKLDELTYQKGNPFLKPEYTNSFSVTHTYNYTLNTSIGYTVTSDFSTQITDTTEGKRNFIQQRNAGTQKNSYLNISYPFSITKWWSVYANFGINRLVSNVNLGPQRISNIARTTWNLYCQQTLLLPKKWSVEISGFYNAPSVWGGTFLNRQFWGVDAGLQKKLLKEKAQLKIGVSDLFLSMRWRGISNFAGLYMDASGGWESRQLKINFNYRFGRKEIKGQRNRSTGSDDIKDRF